MERGGRISSTSRNYWIFGWEPFMINSSRALWNVKKKCQSLIIQFLFISSSVYEGFLFLWENLWAATMVYSLHIGITSTPLEIMSLTFLNNATIESQVIRTVVIPHSQNMLQSAFWLCLWTCTHPPILFVYCCTVRTG